MTFIHNKETLDRALKLCRGSYQRGLLSGYQCLSGADLRGAAKSYISRYRRSGKNLLARCQSFGLNVVEKVGEHNRRDIHIY